MPHHAYQAALFDHYGLDVREYPGWSTRGSTRFAGNGDVWHATVTPDTMPDDRVAALLAHGYAGLPGPLSQRGTARSGTVWVIAAGRCNHNGYGYGGNDMMGNEIMNNGYEEPITAEQMRSSLVQSAALAQYRRWAVTQVLGHKETDKDRKIDPRTVWMPGVRRDVQYLLDTGINTGEFRMDDEARLRISALDQVLARIEHHVTVLGDELFHSPAIDRIEDMPDTGQRKVNFWGLMAGGRRLGETEDKVAVIEQKLDTILDHLGVTADE